MQNPKSITEAVYATICWFDVFEQPVSSEEVQRYLFFQKANLAEVKKTLKRDKRIGSSFGFYFLKGKNALVVKRCQRQYRAGKLWQRVLAKRQLFKRIPFLKLVAVGNTLAMGWPGKKSDIDLLVVTNKEHLFTARIFLTFWLHVLRLRRHRKKITNRFCLSFFLTDKNLDLKELALKPQDPYLAFWVATLTPVWGNYSDKLFEANKWLKKYFPNFQKNVSKKKANKKTWLEKLLQGQLGGLLEKQLKNWQLRRARQKQKTRKEASAVVISENILKFHEKDRRREFLQAWQARLKT